MSMPDRRNRPTTPIPPKRQEERAPDPWLDWLEETQDEHPEKGGRRASSTIRKAAPPPVGAVIDEVTADLSKDRRRD